MSDHVPAAIRRAVAHRAFNICEYCLIHEADTFFGCEIEHIIAKKHGGPTNLENLAYACVLCNRNKGSDISSIDEAGRISGLFNPRLDHWSAHFEFDAITFRISAKSSAGSATVRILDLNHADRLLERENLCAAGRYPPATETRPAPR